MAARDYLHFFKHVRPSGENWVALCPAHEDKHPSLSIREGDGGRLLVHCHAGCTFENILAAAGIEKQSSRRVVTTYDYCDEANELLYQALRYEPKGFSQRRPNGTGGWDYKLNGTRRVLYRLPELIASDLSELVFIVEGEKDADRLNSFGFVATTNSGGAGKWHSEYSGYLRGRRVVIISDNDEPGREHATKIAVSLEGIAASVRILELPNLPPKGDVSDWINAGGVVDELLVLAENAPTFSVGTSLESREITASGTSLQIVRMADVQPETVRWLWNPYIPLGKLTLVDGDPGIGKSTVLCAVGSAISNGKALPGSEPFDPGNVLMLSAEDGLADTLRPRLDAVEADVSRVFALNQPLTFDAEGLVRLEASIIEHKSVLVIIDPLFAYTGGKADIYRANECRAISAPLGTIAERQGCAIVAVRHLSKSRGGGHALNAGIGSIDFAAAARSVLLVGQDPDDPSRRAIVHVKSNLAPIGKAVGYTLDNGRFYWTGESDLTAGRILAAAASEEAQSGVTEAMEFLRSTLSSGSRDNKEIKDEAKHLGISEATLRRAKQRLKIQARKIGAPNSSSQQWVWELPDCEVAHVRTEGVQNPRVERLR